MKTKRKYKAPIFFVLFFGISLRFLVSNPLFKTDKSGIVILTSVFLFLMVLYAISKIVSIEIKNGVLIKNIFGFNRTVNLNSIYKYKVTNIYWNNVFIGKYGSHLLTSLLYDNKYKSLRSLKIYFKDGLGTMTFDERTMTRKEFSKLSTEVKRGKRMFYKLARKKQTEKSN